MTSPATPAPAAPPRKVVLTGPESTGKTRLAARLAARFGSVWVPEFARPYLDLRNSQRPPGGRVCEEEDLLPIATGQIAMEEALAQQARCVLICDTDPVTTVVYADHYFGRCPQAVVDAAAARRYDLTLLLGVDVPWVPDPQRDRPQAREEMLALFRAGLERFGRPYLEIGGDWAVREAAAVAAVERLLG
jgi:HTH-type transcriptional repressor of NAD biosynthesis genes